MTPIWQFSLQSVHALVWGAVLIVAIYLCIKVLRIKAVVIVTTILTLVLVGLGAYVRLTDAGLGCPDWPGCYGKLTPFHADVEIATAQAQSPTGPVTSQKAWNEMLHRYLASLVGAMILSIAIVSIRSRRRESSYAPRTERISSGMPIALLVVVMLQGLFGKWTVTLLLKPAIVTLHLLGGMLILAMLTWLSCRFLGLEGARRPAQARSLRPWATLGLALLAVQIALGGWVSTNYAALACTDFPMCHGEWTPQMDFVHGFQIHRELGVTAQGEPLSNAALNAIHWTHRVGAVVVLIVLGAIAYGTSRMHELGRYGRALAFLLLLQVALGITNVMAMLPLPVAVAHNIVAALLLMAMVVLNFVLRQESTH